MTELSFSEAVRTVRIARGMTQGQLAAAAGISRPHLVAIERGFRPRAQRYNRLVNALGFTLGADLMEAAREKLVSGPRTVGARCESCGTRIAPPGAGRGRPRKRCAACAANRAALGRAWRAANPDRVAAYNVARRRRAA